MWYGDFMDIMALESELRHIDEKIEWLKDIKSIEGDYRIVTGLKSVSKPLWHGAACRSCRGATEHGRREACR